MIWGLHFGYHNNHLWLEYWGCRRGTSAYNGPPHLQRNTTAFQYFTTMRYAHCQYGYAAMTRLYVENMCPCGYLELFINRDVHRSRFHTVLLFLGTSLGFGAGVLRRVKWSVDMKPRWDLWLHFWSVTQRSNWTSVYCCVFLNLKYARLKAFCLVGVQLYTINVWCQVGLSSIYRKCFFNVDETLCVGVQGLQCDQCGAGNSVKNGASIRPG